ncbi:hypothetical protein ES702_01803 [subsurface metagenome]
MSRGIETHSGIVIIPHALTKEEIVEAIWEYAERILTDPDNYKADISELLKEAIFNEVMDVIKNRSGSSFSSDKDSLETAGDESHHTTMIFPYDSNLTLTFTAHADAHEWSSWAEIIDSATNKLSDLFTMDGHLTAFLIEDANLKEKIYIFEIAYGDDKTIVSRNRFIAGETVKLPPIQQIRVRSDHIPTGEKIYYRMKCEQAGSKTCQLHIRYYMHRA